jgi:hypothetical protein
VEFYIPEGLQRSADQAYVVSEIWNSKEWSRSFRLSASVCPLYFFLWFNLPREFCKRKWVGLEVEGGFL